MQKSKYWLLGVLISLVLLVVFSTYYQTNKTTNDIKIGVILPLTSWGSYWGEGGQKGINLAVREINEKDPNFQVIIEDSRTEAKASAAAAQKLISVDKVDGLIAEMSGPTGAASPIANQNKIPFVYDALSKVFLAKNPYAVKVYSDLEQQCYLSSKLLIGKGYNQIGGVILNLDFSPECKKGMTTAATEFGANVKFYDFNMDTSDFRTTILKMKSDKIQAFVPVFLESHAISFFKQLDTLNYYIPFAGGDSRPDMLSQKVINAVPAKVLEGSYAYDYIISDEYKSKIKTLYPEISDNDIFSSAFLYDEVIHLYYGIKDCGRGQPECVVNSIVENKNVPSAVKINGVNSGRFFEYEPIYYQYKGGSFNVI